MSLNAARRETSGVGGELAENPPLRNASLLPLLSCSLFNSQSGCSVEVLYFKFIVYFILGYLCNLLISLRYLSHSRACRCYSESSEMLLDAARDALYSITGCEARSTRRTCGRLVWLPPWHMTSSVFRPLANACARDQTPNSW